MIDLTKMATEQANNATTGFSEMSVKEAITAMHQEDYNAVKSVENQIDMIERVIEMTGDVLSNGGRIVYLGAGTSGRLGLLDAVECPPTFGVDYNTVLGLMAGGSNAFVKALEGAEDSKEYAVNDLKDIHLNEKDVVIGIAASGRTPYVIGGLEYASSIGAKTAGLVCNRNSKIKEICPLTIELETGPEVLTGSTRLKAGTATKLVLNMISTISMIKLGKIYKNYMVDVKMTNEKLVTRGTSIVCSVTQCSEEVAKEALLATENNVKEAIVMILLGCDRSMAQQKLIETKGHIMKKEDTE